MFLFRQSCACYATGGRGRREAFDEFQRVVLMIVDGLLDRMATAEDGGMNSEYQQRHIIVALLRSIDERLLLQTRRGVALKGRKHRQNVLKLSGKVVCSAIVNR